MTKQVLKSIATGLILGGALFLMPFFILKIAVFFIVISSLLRFFMWRMFRRFLNSWGAHPFADSINNRQQYNRQGGGLGRRGHQEPRKVIIIN